MSASAKSPRRTSKSQKKKTGPTVSDLIVKAMAASKERTGMSLAALKKALLAGGYDVVKNKARILNAVRRLVANKSLVQIKGTGASGSFKLNGTPPTPQKKKVVKRRKSPKAKKVKSASAKEEAGDAAPAAIQAPKKKRKTKSPKKAKRPAAVKRSKSPKKAKRPAAVKRSKNPRKAKCRAVKSTRTRAAAKK
ncbi:protamine-like protein [Diretmus argenteus]